MGPELRESLEPGSVEESLLAGVDFERLPRHVAVIMDGNGRWAAARRRPRVFGHRQGTCALRAPLHNLCRPAAGFQYRRTRG